LEERSICCTVVLLEELKTKERATAPSLVIEFEERLMLFRVLPTYMHTHKRRHEYNMYTHINNTYPHESEQGW